MSWTPFIESVGSQDSAIVGVFNDKVIPEMQKQSVLLEELLSQIKLLNQRFELTFESGLDIEDIDNGYKN